MIKGRLSGLSRAGLMFGAVLLIDAKIILKPLEYPCTKTWRYAMYREVFHQISFSDFNQSCGMQLDINNEWVILADSIKSPALTYFRKRLSVEEINDINNDFLETADPTPEHQECNESERAKEANTTKENTENKGSFIMDATCSPSNIRYPQDYFLLNEAREKLEQIIDSFHNNHHPWKKPRTYREVARKEYLALAKCKKRSKKQVRSTIRKMLGYVKRDLLYIEKYMSEGYAMSPKFINNYLVILELYEQQKYMFDNKVNRVDNRIVSISQPYIRPIVRGKVKAPTEFGAKYDVSIDSKGHARLEKISFDQYNEGRELQDAIERYKKRTGHYPARVLVDQIYRTRENREYCKSHGIEISGPKLGRPSKESRKSTKEEYQDNTDRDVGNFFVLYFKDTEEDVNLL